MTLQTWIIEPRDSLIVRDGKPFGANITNATSLDFPFPSTTTGGTRTRAGLDQNGRFDLSQIQAVTDISVKGPLLAEIEGSGKVEFLLHAPADSLLLQNDSQKAKNEASLYRLLPLDIPGSVTNLKGLFPVGLNNTEKKGKPCGELAFWNWTELRRWLNGYKEGSIRNLGHYGIGRLHKDARTHVSINLEMASDDGNLFSTRGLEFTYGNGSLSNTKRLALVVFVDEENSKKLENKGDIAPLGGERRLVSWREDTHQHSILTCGPDIKDQIIKDKHCRLLLLTPAHFSDIFENTIRSDFEIKAIANSRFQTVSGWNFETNRPKPTRRLLPAGSVLFLNLQNNKDIASWVDKTWFSCIGNNDQAQKDGFGLSVLGTWDGETKEVWE